MNKIMRAGFLNLTDGMATKKYKWKDKIIREKFGSNCTQEKRCTVR